jgi:hypothetical protein
MKRLFILLVGASMIATLAGTTAANATTSTPKVTGSVALGSPVQYASFDAFASTPVKGSISYTNFELAAPGSGVWLPAGTFHVEEMYQGGGPYEHTLTVTGFTPTSPTSLTFSGTGFYAPDPSWTETFTGTVNGSNISMKLVPDDGGAKYGWTSMTLNGTIGAGGVISGMWSDTLGRLDSFTTDVAAHEVFHYVAPMASVSVNGSNATFSFYIPAGVPLAGTLVTVQVHDGGSSGAAGDTWMHNGGTYPITSGNLTVFSS